MIRVNVLTSGQVVTPGQEQMFDDETKTAATGSPPAVAGAPPCAAGRSRGAVRWSSSLVLHRSIGVADELTPVRRRATVLMRWGLTLHGTFHRRRLLGALLV